MSPRAPVTCEDARAVLGAWSGMARARVQPLGHGLINDTFAVDTDDGTALVLQRVHPVFSPRIHDNIARVTERLASCGLSSPRLVPTRDGARWQTVAGAPWRVMTRVSGVTHDAVSTASQAHAAAALLGRFHGALAELSQADFVGMRSGVHDTPAHLAGLRAAVDGGAQHRLYDHVAPLAQSLLDQAERLPSLPDAPPRVAHGDPKFNNVVFAGASGADAQRAVAWIDLDTVGPLPLAYELGDAWRSWCNPAGEDCETASFDHAVFVASLKGWASTVQPGPTAVECEALVLGIEWITLELSARFLADALRETYFGWDTTRFAGRGEHNLVRARSQWSLHGLVVQARAARAEAVRRVTTE
ncbi:MAG: aminoglycoside phosphotransferase family protein [Nannocystaceae bacterium]|nr:aminoglycoside phosphotransferase family protein [Nannocystaceae bacterium]